MKKSFFALAALTLVLTSCGAKTVQVGEDEGEILEQKEYKVTINNGKQLVDPVHGKEESLWYGAVLGVNETNANGIAYVHRFEDGTSILTVNLNILQAGAGESFSVALKNAAGAEMDGGVLASIVGDARHSAKFETTENVEGFTTVAIYKHASGQKQLVAEGTVKEAPQK